MSRQEFDTFIVIYACHVDYVYSEGEKRFAEKHTHKVVYDKMFALFNSLNDYQCLKVILKYSKQYYSSEEEKNLFFKRLKIVFQADGEISRMESVFVAFISKLMVTDIQ